MKKVLKSNIKTILKKTFSSEIDYSYNTENFLNKIKQYENGISDVLNQYELLDNPISGYATKEKTKYYSQRNMENVHKSNFKETYEGLTISSLGLGSYVGKPDDLTDFYLYNSVKNSVLSGGINHIDTAINYRYMKSERTIGKALQTLINKYKFSREELIISSKIGFIPENAEEGHRCHYFVEKLVESKKIDINDIIYDENKRPVHCIHPEFLKSQIEISLKNLNLETIDILYLQNVFETQLKPKAKILYDLSKSFECLQQMIEEKKIKNYGLATWNSLRVPISNIQQCPLQQIVELVEKVCGKNNGFKFIQTPINLMNPEAFIEKHQPFNIYFENGKYFINDKIKNKNINKLNFTEKEYKEKTLSASINNPLEGSETKDLFHEAKEKLNKLEPSKEEQELLDKMKLPISKTLYSTVTSICNAYKLNLISSSPLLQGLLVDLTLENKIPLIHNASRHLQIIRSVPAECLKSTLVGMNNNVHLKNNLEVLKIPLFDAKEFSLMLSPKKRQPFIEKELL